MSSEVYHGHRLPSCQAECLSVPWLLFQAILTWQSQASHTTSTLSVNLNRSLANTLLADVL